MKTKDKSSNFHKLDVQIFMKLLTSYIVNQNGSLNL